MEIKAHSKTYQVLFEDNWNFIDRISQIGEALWVVDAKVYQLYRDILNPLVPEEKILLMEATEENKVMDTVLKICDRMTNLDAKRNSCIISVGGGIIQDITGFAANILYRGVKWIFIPTTLLASCDSCIGSKTSLNFKNFKNLLGTFYPPDEIHTCPAFFRTLSQVDFYSGLGEVVKFCIMAGEDGLTMLEKDMPLILERDEKTVIKYVHRSLEFKKDFIEKDEYDKGVRVYLNFAHTFGHAFEVVTQFAIPHGTAVAMGMMVANNIALKRGNINDDIKNRAQKLLLEIIDIKLLEVTNHLQFSDVENSKELMRAIRKDKKQVDKRLTAVIFADSRLNLEIVHDVQEKELLDAVAEMYQDILGK